MCDTPYTRNGSFYKKETLMAIDFEKEVADHPHLDYKVHQRWTINDHEVALATGHWTEDDGSTRELDMLLLCECDFTKEERVVGGENDPRNCAARKEVRESVLKEAHAAYGDAWKKMGLKEAIVDVFQRHVAKEYLGSTNAESLYAQDIANILKADQRRVMQFCQELRDEERLELWGWTLHAYEPYLRLPHELKALFAYMIEEPIGWPNGDAGDCFVSSLTGLIEEHAGYTHGSDLFGSENFPHIAPRHLLVTGTMWLLDATNNESSTDDFTGEARGLRSLAARAKGIVALGGCHDEPIKSTATAEETRTASDGSVTCTRFTFPREIKDLLITLHEDTGKDRLGAVQAINHIEETLSAIADYPDGEKAFWEHNHPHVSPHILWMFGTMWITSALEHMESSKDIKTATSGVRLDIIAHMLEDLADQLERSDG